jgi:hypothetical protein
MEGDYEGTQFGFAFGFLVRFVNAVEVGVAWLPGQAQVRPKMVENLCEPSLAGKKRRAIVVVICVFLLERDPIVTEATAEKVGRADVIMRRN